MLTVREKYELSVDETGRTLREYLDALLSGRDFAAFFADDVTWTTMGSGDEIHGREAVSNFIVALHSQFFAASPELKTVIVGDGVAAVEAVFVGTHTAEVAGVPETSAAVRLPYAVGYDVSAGKIDALRAYFPLMALVQQLRDAAAARS